MTVHSVSIPAMNAEGSCCHTRWSCKKGVQRRWSGLNLFCDSTTPRGNSCRGCSLRDVKLAGECRQRAQVVESSLRARARAPTQMSSSRSSEAESRCMSHAYLDSTVCQPAPLSYYTLSQTNTRNVYLHRLRPSPVKILDPLDLDLEDTIAFSCVEVSRLLAEDLLPEHLATLFRKLLHALFEDHSQSKVSREAVSEEVPRKFLR